MDTTTHPIVSAQEWEAARQQLLVKEKELTRARDALAAERRRMPWLAVEKDYAFEGPQGRASLLDLFDGRRQLIVYRAFFEPGVHGWPDHACPGCSLVADQVAHLAHLNARDTTLVFASRAAQPDIARLKERMDWDMPWFTLTDGFDADHGVDEWHGTNAFFRDGDRVFRTYFVNARGDETMGSTWSYLDITALGRQEAWEDSPPGYPQTPPYSWWRWHDTYGDEGGRHGEETTGAPQIVDRATWQAARDTLLVREKAHTHEGDAIAAARRRLPMVEIDPAVTVIGPDGPVPLREAFEGRSQLVAYYFMWHPGQAAPAVCEGCTFYTSQVRELSYLHSRDVTYAVFCYGPYDESVRYRDFMGWDVPWYSVLGSTDALLAGRSVGMMHIVCYLRDGDRVFETYETTVRGVEAMDNTYGLLDLTVYGRQETWEDSPPGWPQRWSLAGGEQVHTDGRPTAQWARLAAKHSDELGPLP